MKARQSAIASVTAPRSRLALDQKSAAARDHSCMAAASSLACNFLSCMCAHGHAQSLRW